MFFIFIILNLKVFLNRETFVFFTIFIETITCGMMFKLSEEQ